MTDQRPDGTPDIAVASDDEGHEHSHRRYIWFAVILGAVILTFAAISITVVVRTL